MLWSCKFGPICSRSKGRSRPVINLFLRSLQMDTQNSAQVLDSMAAVQSCSLIHRHPKNPILTADDIPYPSRLVYNAGVTKFRGRYVMVFRNDYGYDEQLRKAP